MAPHKGVSVPALHAAIGNLDPLKRAVLHLRFWENMEIAEIAKATRLQWSEADWLIDLAVSELRQTLSGSTIRSFVTNQTLAKGL